MSQKPNPARTLVFLVRDDEILLGQKKRHHAKAFGVGKWNGFGGKVDPGESLEEAMIRECQEECGATPTAWEKVAVNNFLDDYAMLVHVYLVTAWRGEITETAEMKPQWFKKSAVPYAQMWNDDIFWLPAVLQGNKLIAHHQFAHSDDHDGTAENPIEAVKIKIVDSLDPTDGVIPT